MANIKSFKQNKIQKFNLNLGKVSDTLKDI